MSDVTTRTLTERPHLGRLFAKGALGGTKHRGGPLPSTELVLEDARVDVGRLADYARVCGFRLGDTLPPTYPHVMAFPLQIALMADRSFPFALPGLVHVRNVIDVHRELPVDGRLHIAVQAADLAPHPKGAQVDLVTRVEVDGELAWSSRSTYLARGAKAPDDAQTSVQPGASDESPTLSAAPVSTWRVAANTGRRYAKVSGDVNPIHLNPLAARAFGFPRMIAHGMWGKARALASLEGRIPATMHVDVRFQKPLLLPSTVELRTNEHGDAWTFALAGRGAEHVHLRGVAEPV